MDVKSQFVSSGNSSAGTSFLLGSLSLAVADTRRGFTPDIRATVDSLSAHVAANPQAANADNFAKYIQKITPQTAEVRPAAASRKPATGVTG